MVQSVNNLQRGVIIGSVPEGEAVVKAPEKTPQPLVGGSYAERVGLSSAMIRWHFERRMQANVRQDGAAPCATVASVKTNNQTVASSDPINVVLPPAGRGYTVYNRERGGADQYGRAKTIRAIQEIAADWATGHKTKLQIGDISRKGGGKFPPHKTHQDGRAFDMRPLRKDGALEPTNIHDKSYDREQTRELIKLIKRKYPKATILFNDEVLIKEGLTKRAKGHHNHLHVVVK